MFLTTGGGQWDIRGQIQNAATPEPTLGGGREGISERGSGGRRPGTPSLLCGELSVSLGDRAAEEWLGVGGKQKLIRGTGKTLGRCSVPVCPSPDAELCLRKQS